MNGTMQNGVGPILVVDDERFFQTLLSKILTEAGYEVVVAGTGREALELFNEHGFPVVVLDLVLPDIMGTDVLVQVREKDPDAAVIMITAYASMESAIDALKAGAYDYIQKPIVREDLLRAVERALERQQLAVRNRKLIEELEDKLGELRTMGAEKEEVFRILDEGLVILEGDGSIFDMNEKAAAMTQLSGSSWVGADFMSSKLPIPETFLESIGESGTSPVRAMINVDNDNASFRSVELVGITFNGTTKPGRYLICMRDLTAIREMEKKREEFMAIVTHDLRTPLTSMKGFVELLLGNYESDPLLSEYLNILDSEADRMISLISDLLDLDRIDSERMDLHEEDISVVDIVKYALKSMVGIAEKKQVATRLKVELEGGGLIRADRKRVLQILVNIYSNALQYSPDGGNVDTRISRDERGVLVEISDEGPGIPLEDREAVFEKYRQLSPAAPKRLKGSGLGLTIVKRLMDLHGGDLWLEDVDGKKGIRFVLRFPVEEKGD